MKLFTKDINQKLFAQYRIGSDLNKQKVVAKIFNPYGEGRWYLLNSDPNDPDYLWAIVQIGDNVEIGSVSRSELERARIKPFGLPLERDTYFSDRVAIEVLEGLEKGQTFAAGGMTAGRWYKDNSGKEFRFIGESEGKLLFKDGEKIITKSEEDFEDAPKEKKLFGIFADGGEVGEYEVELSAAPNVDYDEDDYNGYIKIKKHKKKVSSIDEAILVVRNFISENDLGGGNWTGGDVYKNGKKIGAISYNGRYWEGGYMKKGGLIKIGMSNIEDSDFQSLSQIFESNDAAFSIDESEEYVLMDLKGLPDGNEKQEALEIIGKYNVQRMDKGGKINWGEDLGDGFSIGNDVYIKDSSSRFFNKNGYLVGKIGQRLVIQVGEDDMYAVVSKEKVEKLNAPMAKGGNINSDLSDKELKDLVERLSKEKTLDKKEEYALMKAKYMLEKRDSSTKMADGGEIDSEDDDIDYNSISDLQSERNRLVRWSNQYGSKGADYTIKKLEERIEYLKSKDNKMAKGGSTPRTIKLTLSHKDSYDYTYKQDGATASITFGFGKEPFQYEVKKISKSLEPLKEDILDAFTIQGIKQHEYKGGFSEAIKHLDTKVVYEDKMAEGGMVEHGLKIGDKIVSDQFWDKKIVVENTKTHKKALINLETGVRKEEMGMGGDTAAAEHNIKQAKYGARLVGKQKNLDVNKNGKLDSEDFKMLRGEKMADGGYMADGGWIDEVLREIEQIKKKYPKSKVSYYFAKNGNGKNYVIEAKENGKVVYSSYQQNKMAMGGKVKFEDKVKEVQKSLLKRKKVAPVVQKDYGKTYNRKEALESAKRIIGAQTAKWEKRNNK
jgi:hypothetical protein